MQAEAQKSSVLECGQRGDYDWDVRDGDRELARGS
jgi:hypothetical protein